MLVIHIYPYGRDTYFRRSMSPQWVVDVDELFVGCLYRKNAVKYEQGGFLGCSYVPLLLLPKKKGKKVKGYKKNEKKEIILKSWKR